MLKLARVGFHTCWLPRVQVPRLVDMHCVLYPVVTTSHLLSPISLNILHRVDQYTGDG